MEKKITTVREPARDIPVRASADILIVGGGPAGLMAAQAAAGEGLKVMLIESRGYLGGNLTIGLPILGFLGQKGNQIIGIEVKKGEHVRSRSLSVFVNNYKPAYSIRLSLKNFGEKDGLKSVPLYAAFCI